MAKTEGEPVLDSEQEEIALSDSELDSVLKSADITSEAPDEGAADLEQYGVWVKVEPQNLEEEAERNMSFDLSDLDGGSESALSEEEEQLLGELEEDEQADLGDLSGLEDDLEELGKGNAFDEAGGEEELSVEDLDVDLDELGEGTPEDTGDLGGLPEMEEEEALGLDLEPDSEIEVPLSDSAIVEEHYEDLATVEGVPSMPGEAPQGRSSDILEKIERDLNQIKSEIQSLKSELAGLGKGTLSGGKVDVAPAPSGSEGFFEKGEEETIALTGDELDNILNTADVTEEVDFPEQSLESPTLEELPDMEEVEGEDIMGLGSLDLEEEEAPSEELSLDDAELSLDELEPSEGEDESIEIEIGEKTTPEELDLEEELISPDSESEGLEELSLEEGGIEEGEVSEELSLAEGGLEEAGAPEELSLEEPSEELELEELDELGLEEGGLEEAEAPEELPLEEAAEVLPSEELTLEEPAQEPALEELDELGLEEAEAAEDLEELSLEEPGLEEVESPEELGLEEMPVEENLEGVDEDVSALDELAGEAEPGGAAEGIDLDEEELAIPESEPITADSQPTSTSMTEDLKSEIKSVLSYFDQLLEALPEEKIKEFAQSEYFVRYKRLFEELGLGA